MNINYSAILTKAWNITWKFKVLWFFGFLAMLGGSGGWSGSSGNGGGFNSSFNFNGSNSQYQSDYRSVDQNIPPELRSTYDQLAQIDLNTWITVAVVACCVLAALGLGIWLLSIVGRGGLIGGILAAETNGKVTFREAWNLGTHNFLRLFLIRLLAIAVGIVLVVVVALPGAILGVLTCGLGFIPLVCVMFILGIAINIWFAFMDFAVVTEKLGVGEAIGRAWRMMRDHIGPVIIFYLILFAISLGVGVAMLILLAPSIVVLFLSILPLITATAGLNVTLLVIGIILLVLYILAAWLVEAVFTVWQTSVMVLAYREFSVKTPLLTVSTESPPAITS